MKNKPKKCWSKPFGKRGEGPVVRVYEARPGGPLMRSIYINGKEDRKSLGHRDKDRARREAYELLAQLGAEEKAIEQQSPTLGMILRLYLESSAHRKKKERTQKEDVQRLKRVVAFWGPGRSVDMVTRETVDKFIEARRRGDEGLVGIKPGIEVRTRSIQADLVALRTMLHWAVAATDQKTEQRLLRQNPFAGIKLAGELNPKRPVTSQAEYVALLDVARTVSPLLWLALIVAGETGRRLSAWRQLRWSDVNFDKKTIRWRAENDKKGYEGRTPMSDVLTDALRDHRRVQAAFGDGWVFPAPSDPAQPCSRHRLDTWLRLAYKRAKLDLPSGGLWHPLRRKWASERRGYPLADVASAGGWKGTQTLSKCYIHADDEAIRRVMFNPTHRVGGEESTHNTTHNTGAGQ